MKIGFRSKLNDYYISNISTTQMDEKFIYCRCDIDIHGSCKEVIINKVDNHLARTRRKAYEASFNQQMENIISGNDKIR